MSSHEPGGVHDHGHLNDEAVLDALHAAENAEGSVDPAAAVDTEDRRAHERLGVRRVARLSEIGEDARLGVEVVCELVDISRGGCGVECRRMVMPGRLVRLELGKPQDGGKKPNGVRRVFFCIVANCQYVGRGVHLIGLQFHKGELGK